ncbi:hypothetical protein OROHE_008062 [Orobanche hederae]
MEPEMAIIMIYFDLFTCLLMAVVEGCMMNGLGGDQLMLCSLKIGMVFVSISIFNTRKSKASRGWVLVGCVQPKSHIGSEKENCLLYIMKSHQISMRPFGVRPNKTVRAWPKADNIILILVVVGLAVPTSGIRAMVGCARDGDCMCARCGGPQLCPWRWCLVLKVCLTKVMSGGVSRSVAAVQDGPQG